MNNRKNFPWRFWIQIIPLILLMFWVGYINTPASVLGSNTMWRLLKFIGHYGGITAFVGALPAGIAGLRWFDEENGLYKATKVLAIINLCITGLAVASVLLYIIMLFF